MPSESEALITRKGILVVEDNPNDLFFLRRAVLRVGLLEPATFLRDGTEAIQYLTGAAPFGNREVFPFPKLIMLDLVMPNVSGWDLLQWKKAQSALRDIPIVVFAELQDANQNSRALSLGASRCYAKTVEVAKWVDMIRVLAMEFGVRTARPVEAESKEGQKAA